MSGVVSLPKNKKGSGLKGQLGQMSSLLRVAMFWGFWAALGLLATWYISVKWSDEGKQNTRWQSAFTSIRNLESQIDGDILTGAKLQSRDTDELDEATQQLRTNVEQLISPTSGFIGTTNQEVLRHVRFVNWQQQQ